MSSARYEQHQAPKCATRPADRTAVPTIERNGVVVSGGGAFTSPQTTIVVTGEGNSAGKTWVDRFLENKTVTRAAGSLVF